MTSLADLPPPFKATADPIAEVIRVELARLRYTQGSLAEALKLVDYALVRRLRGEVDWKLGELRVVAEFLEISVAQLVPGLDQRAA